ncbi:RNA polymerase factor sigma-54 [Amedibacillus sp. YH-ame6]
MKQTLQNKQTLKQNLMFNTALYDSLDILKLSSNELIESIFEAVQDNPLLEIDDSWSTSFEYFDICNTFIKPINLKEHLFSQLHTCNFKYDDTVCTYIIESLDRHGFFVENHEDCSSLLNISIDVLRKHIVIIQSLEPCGVGAKNSLHAIYLQAKKSQNVLAEKILLEHTEDLAKKDYRKIARLSNCSENEVKRTVQFIQSLSPYPCSSFYSENELQILPDLKLEIDDNNLILTPINNLQLHYHDEYMDLMKTNPVLKDYFEQSKVFIANIEKRNATMMLVASEIINQQNSHFLYQSELKPLKQSDIANTLGMNQATVSRAVMNKYYEFENDIFPLSHLFVTSTTKGDSSDAIKKAIRDIISNEDKQHPYSDLQIVEELKNYDYSVSRRTVTKYREAYGIQNTRERKVKSND